MRVNSCKLEIKSVYHYGIGQKFVSPITHEPLNSASWNFASTCRTILNFKVISQWSRSRGFFGVFRCAWCCSYQWAVLSLEQGSVILLSINSELNSSDSLTADTFLGKFWNVEAGLGRQQTEMNQNLQHRKNHFTILTCTRNLYKFLAQVSSIKFSCKFMQVRMTTHQIITGVLARNK